MCDHCHVDCTQCREALSARLDGEDDAAQPGAVEAHLTTCFGCCRFADEAARITKLARTALAAQAPDVTVEPV